MFHGRFTTSRAKMFHVKHYLVSHIYKTPMFHVKHWGQYYINIKK